MSALLQRDIRSTDNPPRLLLIGASGQVGRELLRTLQPLGQVIRTYRGSVGAAAEPELDLSRPEGIRAVLQYVRPELVINAAAYTDVEAAEREPDKAMAINGIAPEILAKEARQIGAALLHYSSDYVFDGSGDDPWHETDRPHPLNAYGRSKLAGEEAIRQSGVEHLIVRTSWVYGVSGKNFVLTMLHLGAEQEHLRIVADQFGAPTSARILAEVTAQILAQARGEFVPFLRRCGGLLHVCCRGETSWHGFAQEIFRQAQRHGVALAVRDVEPISSREYASRAQRPLDSRLDCRRLRRRFGLSPPDYATALELCLEEILASRNVARGPPRSYDAPVAAGGGA